ncbi:hypothetical protein HUO13_28690 [Saccharopolyspora erythraea]|uniref:hypothetical protein n=1 Tax=Saccharopolyspora erythraea TaxID=1836 RepID=UPI001BABD377|nr:hypothetical protein [Saccharopolyspora erythraea]QUH04236.1 hypothetical protein HUO13_28690 [Saccharopolyspora erythraea]
MTQQFSKPNSRQDEVTRSETTNTNNTRNFWKTTGCGVLVTAGCTLIGVLITTTGTVMTSKDDKKALPPAAAPITETVTVTVQQSPAGTAQVPPSPAPADPSMRWEGTFTMSGWANFDTIPPNSELSVGGLFMQSGTGGDLYLGKKGSRWTGAGKPTSEQCLTQVATHAEDLIPVNPGDQICYQTANDNIVYMKILSTAPYGGYARHEMYVVIWNK